MHPLFRQAVVIVFIASFLTHTIGNGFFVVDYYLNTAKYEQNCINKARPKLKCKGRCQLMKKIQEQEEKQKHEKSIASQTSIILSDKTYFASVEEIPNHNEPIPPLFHSKIKLNSFSPFIFHPPC